MVLEGKGRRWVLTEQLYLVLTCLPYLPREEHFIYHSIDLVEVKHQIQLTHVMKIFIQHLQIKTLVEGAGI